MSERTREIGIGVALGARAKDVLGWVIRQALARVGAGLGLGFAAGLGAARLPAGLLYGAGPADPLTFGGGSLILEARVDPMVALRHE